jgi:hypothetical protein
MMGVGRGVWRRLGGRHVMKVLGFCIYMVIQWAYRVWETRGI